MDGKPARATASLRGRGSVPKSRVWVATASGPPAPGARQSVMVQASTDPTTGTSAMARKRKPSAPTWANLMMLGIESQQVIYLRLAKIAAGGPQAGPAAQVMGSE